MNATPEIRALVKLVFFLLGTLVACLITVHASLIYGPATVKIGLVLMLLAVFAKWFYDSAVAEERHKDKLKELQKTINE